MLKIRKKINDKDQSLVEIIDKILKDNIHLMI